MNEFYNKDLREPRVGIMIHYDDSSTDKWGLVWLRDDPRAGVSYNLAYPRAGGSELIAPLSARAWHAGVCTKSPNAPAYKDANSAFYGLAFMLNAGERHTEKQMAACVADCIKLFREHKWAPGDVFSRIVEHATEASPRGRKIDPIGPDKNRPIVDMNELRARVYLGLIAQPTPNIVTR